MRNANAKYDYPVAFLQKKDKEFEEAVKKGTATRAVRNAVEGKFENDREENDNKTVGEASSGGEEHEGEVGVGDEDGEEEV